MEYKLFKYLRHHIKIPSFLRFIFGTFFILISLFPIILPLFPFSSVIGVFILVIGIILIVPGHKIRYVVKIRKGIIYITKNISRRQKIKHKIKDIKAHINQILKDY